MNIRRPVFIDPSDAPVRRIDCEIEHPNFGWLPFTASPDDTEEHGRAIHAAALAMGPAPYVSPDPEV